MATLYSAQLWKALNEPSGTYNSVTVPSGYIWVVRDVVVVPTAITAARPSFAYTFTLSDGGGIPIFTIPYWYAVGGASYHWAGHQVIVTGDNLRIVCAATSFSWRISGFTLTTP